ncbi:hypothetical protein KCH_35210 [Kitasatospora cheerisanensis KCTC 2395]|uniref:Uncharacterized protein n=1 Tax=Kitasatospora cheerisanensis KCTC 2395 TaxID=1348663 RepID=A0A066Z2V3_9ACTN|nr:hypothetical protein KCH_35210 [Kitasatospora cheerisanensis KCTC 2395]
MVSAVLANLSAYARCPPRRPPPPAVRPPTGVVPAGSAGCARCPFPARPGSPRFQQ